MLQIATTHANQIRDFLDVNHIVGGFISTASVSEAHTQVGAVLGGATNLLEVLLNILDSDFLKSFVALRQLVGHITGTAGFTGD